jgi:hypothetical protein
VGFELQNNHSGITGSFAGGTSDSKLYIDGTTLNAIIGGPSTSAAQSPSICEPTLSGKFTAAVPGASDSVAIKLKKPKGLKGITIDTGASQGTDFAPHPTNSSVTFTG